MKRINRISAKSEYKVFLYFRSKWVENSACGRGSKFTVTLPARNVLNENNLYDRKVGNKKQCIQVELSDVNL
ncbi:hypothetical protein [Clostridium sp.]|uniref:hypothetical protein n=1 Tax=Clostridium sp. TaxID=1506 RepID=UPI0025BB8CC0|nr:hypothetical protein [Clostridium sp.]